MGDQIDYKKLMEAALFMSPKALSLQDLSGVTGVRSIGHIEETMNKLVSDYRARDTALEIIEIDKKYMFALKEPYAGRVSGLASGPEISKSSLRLLAYISKNNNAMQSDLVKIFGESTYEHMKELVEKGFVDRRKQGRSRRISVTNKFKEYFNVSS